MPKEKPTESFALEEEQYQGAGDLTPIAQYCQDLYHEYSSSDYRKRKFQEIQDARERYDADRKEKTFPWKNCSNISLGLSAIAVDNLEPRIVKQVISDDDFLVCKPVGKEDIHQADAVKEFLHWALRNNVKVNEAIRPLIHEYLIAGTIDIIPVWRERVDEVRIRSLVPQYAFQGQPIKLPPGQEISEEEARAMGLEIVGLEDSYRTREETSWRVEYVIVPLDDAFFPDNWDGWADAPYLRYIYPTLEELELMSRENGGPYYNITRDLVIEGARNQTDDESRFDKDISYSLYTKEVRVLECYVKWRGEWRIASFAVDRGWIEIRNQPLADVYWFNRKPVHRFRLFPDTRHSMGTGIPHKVRHYATAVDDLVNEMIDSGTVEIIPWFTYQAGPGFSQIDLDLYPGKGVEVPKGSKVEFPQLGVKAPQFITFINLIMGFFERVVSLSEYAMGKEGSIGGKGAETFSGMNLIVSEGNVKHAYTAEYIRQQFASLFRSTLALYGQYMPLDASMRIQGDDGNWMFKPVDVVALQGQYDVEIEVSSASANKMLHRKEMVELLQLLQSNPAINPMQLAEKILDAYDIRNMEDWLKPEFQTVMAALVQAPEVAQVVDQYMKKKAAEMRRQEIAQQAQANIERQAIERQVEREAGAEDAKLLDQVTESAKRKAIQPAVDHAVSQGAI